MSITGPPPDPFSGMTSEERRCSQEAVILGMAYDLSRFQSVIPRERPDFALALRLGGRPFGVEVTQLFFNESEARLHLRHDYSHRLWSGGSHLHKKDIKALRPTTVTVTDKDRNLRHTGLPAIFTDVSTLPDFRSRLRGVIENKSAKSYDVSEFTHLNLVIHDWFRLDFDANKYLTSRFFDDNVRAALRTCAFREVLLIIYNTVHATEKGREELAQPDPRVIPLQQMLATERFYVTFQIIHQECDGILRDVAELNRLAIDHVSRVQGYGDPVLFEARPCLRYGGTLLDVNDHGMRVYDLTDCDTSKYPGVSIPDRMKPVIENRVTERAIANVFGGGHAPLANRPKSWG
jgi:hypothetical protein